MNVVVVHILKHGYALCGIGAPLTWPDGHKWVSFERVDQDIGDSRPKLCVHCMKARIVKPAG